MKPVTLIRRAGDEVALTPDIGQCKQKATPREFGCIPDNIEFVWTNNAGMGVLAPQIVIGFPDLFSPDEGQLYSFPNLHQKYRAAAALENKSYGDWIRDHQKELSQYWLYCIVAGVVTDADIVIRAW